MVSYLYNFNLSDFTKGKDKSPVKLADCAGLWFLLLEVLGDVGEEDEEEDDAKEESGKVGKAGVLPHRRLGLRRARCQAGQDLSGGFLGFGGFSSSYDSSDTFVPA